MFWIGFLIGMFSGATISVFGLTILMMSRRFDELSPSEERAPAASSTETMDRCL